MSGQRSFLICYDIAHPKRLRTIERIMEGYGYRVQESVFFCRLGALMLSRIQLDVSKVINREKDQWFLVDLGEAPDIMDHFVVLGKKIKKIPKITLI